MKTSEKPLLLIGLMIVLNLSGLVGAQEARAQSQVPCPVIRADAVPTATQDVARKTIAQFVSQASQNREICDLLVKHQLTLQYTVTDLGMNFHLGCAGSKVVCGMGGTASPAEIAFMSNWQDLDQLMRGTGSKGQVQVTIKLNLLRELEVKRDFGKLRAALMACYVSACQTTASEQTLVANSR